MGDEDYFTRRYDLVHGAPTKAKRIPGKPKK